MLDLIKAHDYQDAVLEKLKLEGITNNDFISILKNIDINIKNRNKFNIKTLGLKNFGSIDFKIESSKLNRIKKLKVQKGGYINILTISNLFIEHNKNLSSLSLEFINMTDIGFQLLISSLIKNPNITNTLEYLSLEGNRITIVKYDKEDNKNQNQFFQNLKTLNLVGISLVLVSLYYLTITLDFMQNKLQLTSNSLIYLVMICRLVALWKKL